MITILKFTSKTERGTLFKFSEQRLVHFIYNYFIVFLEISLKHLVDKIGRLIFAT